MAQLGKGFLFLEKFILRGLHAVDTVINRLLIALVREVLGVVRLSFKHQIMLASFSFSQWFDG